MGHRNRQLRSMVVAITACLFLPGCDPQNPCDPDQVFINDSCVIMTIASDDAGADAAPAGDGAAAMKPQ